MIQLVNKKKSLSTCEGDTASKTFIVLNRKVMTVFMTDLRIQRKTWRHAEIRQLEYVKYHLKRDYGFGWNLRIHQPAIQI